MFPVLFKIGTFEVRSYGILLIVGFIVGIALAKKRAPRFGISAKDLTDASLMTLLAGILGARIAFVLLELPYYLQHPSDLLTWRFQGLTSFGGLIGGLLYLVWFCRKRGLSLLSMLDVFAGPMLVAHAIGRIGCLLNGCCYGALCKAGESYCIAAEGQPGLYQPAQVIDAILNLVGYGLLLMLEKRNLVRGQSLALFMILHGSSRFVYEFWRAGTTSETLGPITIAQALCLAIIVGGIVLFRAASSQGSANGPMERGAN